MIHAERNNGRTTKILDTLAMASNYNIFVHLLFRLSPSPYPELCHQCMIRAMLLKMYNQTCYRFIGQRWKRLQVRERGARKRESRQCCSRDSVIPETYFRLSIVFFFFNQMERKCWNCSNINGINIGIAHSITPIVPKCCRSTSTRWIDIGQRLFSPYYKTRALDTTDRHTNSNTIAVSYTSSICGLLLELITSST